MFVFQNILPYYFSDDDAGCFCKCTSGISGSLEFLSDADDYYSRKRENADACGCNCRIKIRRRRHGNKLVGNSGGSQYFAAAGSVSVYNLQ